MIAALSIKDTDWPFPFSSWPEPDVLLHFGLIWAGVIVAALAANLVMVSVIVRLIRSIAARTQNHVDDVIMEHRVLQRLARVVPALVVHASAPLLFTEGSPYVDVLRRIAMVGVIFAVSRSVDALLSALITLGQRSKSTKDKPIRPYVQVAKILLWLTSGILIVGVALDRSPWALLTGLGALTAIILLVFKDSILGFVASIQIATNDLIRVGDWITMDAYSSDGDVIDIGLHVVKVQNWDKTVSSIPTQAFLTSTFKNWRGMTESGGRRIKRSLAIDMTTVRFLSDEDLEQLGKIEVLKGYLAERTDEVERWNGERVMDMTAPANGRRLTNLGTLRAYLRAYLAAHPQISDEMTFLVRQLSPGPEGLPIEIYVFSEEQRWVQYEAIIGDVFDHLLAVLPTFSLRPFQRPTGADLEGLTGER